MSGVATAKETRVKSGSESQLIQNPKKSIRRSIMKKTSKGIKGFLRLKKKSRHKLTAEAHNKVEASAPEARAPEASTPRSEASLCEQPKTPSSSTTASASKPPIAPSTTSVGDETTVYGVHLDDVGSVATPRTSAPPPESSRPVKPGTQSPSSRGGYEEEEEDDDEDEIDGIRVVLLLIEVTTRRFELLQLDFDPHKATVKDVLTQINEAATEPALRNQTYAGICTPTGNVIEQVPEMNGFNRLGSNEVALAVPMGISEMECAKLAAPILDDPRIMSMLRPVLEAASARSSAIHRHYPSVNTEEMSQKTVHFEQKSVPQTSSYEVDNLETDEGNALVRSATPVTSSQRDQPRLWAKLRIPVLMVLLAFYLHSNIRKPLAPGDQLRSGQFRTKCGLLTIVPEKHSGCHDLSVKFDKKGALILYDVGSVWSGHQRKVLWRVASTYSSAWRNFKNGKSWVSSQSDFNETSVLLAVLDDGTVTIANEKVTLEYATGSLRDAVLSPWPFELEPRISRKKRMSKRKAKALVEGKDKA